MRHGVPMIMLIMMACLFVAGMIFGYFMGRRAGQREAQQGFPVLPVATAVDDKSNTIP